MELVFQAVVIGILQGLTEFIPISSSAHLQLAPWLFGWQTDGPVSSLSFDVFLHLGTVAALLVYFARDWIRLARAFVASVVERRIGVDPDRRMAWLLLMATIPAAIIGFVGEEWIADVLHGETSGVRIAIAGFMVVGAVGLWLADRFGQRRRELDELAVPSALTIGFSQALALFPGISRSGATITAGLALGFTREAAARFSFLLATPIILGAGLYGSRHLLEEAHTGNEWLAIVAGFASALVFGMMAIGFLLGWLRTRSVAIFSIYRVIFAIVVVGLVLIGY